MITLTEHTERWRGKDIPALTARTGTGRFILTLAREDRGYLYGEMVLTLQRKGYYQFNFKRAEK